MQPCETFLSILLWYMLRLNSASVALNLRMTLLAQEGQARRFSSGGQLIGMANRRRPFPINLLRNQTLNTQCTKFLLIPCFCAFCGTSGSSILLLLGLRDQLLTFVDQSNLAISYISALHPRSAGIGC